MREKWRPLFVLNNYEKKNYSIIIYRHKILLYFYLSSIVSIKHKYILLKKNESINDKENYNSFCVKIRRAI